MVQCYEAECNHQSLRDKCKFFRFPKDLDNAHEGWKTVANRRLDRRPTQNDRLCSCHFENENKARGPTLLGGRKTETFRDAFSDLEPPKKKSKEPKATEKPTASVVDEPGKLHSSCTTSRKQLVMDAIIDSKEQELAQAQSNLNYARKRFTVKEIEGDDKAFAMYTGLPNYLSFVALLNLCNRFKFNYWQGWNVTDINKEEQLLMTLMKLRQNFNNLDLAYRFRCSKTTVTNVVITWAHALEAILCRDFMDKIPSVKKNQTSLPSCFSDFDNTRIVLDCTEIFIKVPKNMREQNLTWSSYKHANTFKGLVGVAPNGVVTYVSNLYSGSTSDKAITKDCAILGKMEPGDTVMADKGFLIHDMMPDGVALNMPPFLKGKQFSKDQCIYTRSVARARIHVERAIQRIKLYKILKEIPASLRPFANTVWKACAGLTNLHQPLIKEVQMG